ncbi:hypothetical protein JYU14_01100 [Simkania negevensis]|uniref:Uncharacterized protein n=1 Tax=Simkania negevensis TaxID=83561 RepID=A0ABS3AQA5_9BACT|nr:hypothetical protein [Simkania negevensis]
MDFGRLSDSFRELESAHAAKESHNYYVDREGALKKKGWFERFTLWFKGHPDENTGCRQLAVVLFTKLQLQYQSERSSSKETFQNFLSKQITFARLDQQQVGRLLRVAKGVLASQERPPDLVPKFHEQFRNALSARQQEQVAVCEFLKEGPFKQSSLSLENLRARLMFLEKKDRLLAPSMISEKSKEDLQKRCGLSDEQMEILEEKFAGLQHNIGDVKSKIEVKESEKASQSGGVEQPKATYSEGAMVHRKAWYNQRLQSESAPYFAERVDAIIRDTGVSKKEANEEALDRGDVETMKVAYDKTQPLLTGNLSSKDAKKNSIAEPSMKLQTKIAEEYQGQLVGMLNALLPDKNASIATSEEKQEYLAAECKRTGFHEAYDEIEAELESMNVSIDDVLKGMAQEKTLRSLIDLNPRKM